MNKYNARRTVVDGITFASKGEAERYRQLKLLEYGGRISDLVLQPKFVIQEPFIDGCGIRHRGITYRADFQYVDRGNLVVEDFKGEQTEVFKLKMKLFLYRYRNVVFRITK